jgi:hypothetical protein
MASLLTLPLTAEEVAAATDVLENGADADVLVSCFAVELTRKDARCLVDCEWLNDEVINISIKRMLAKSKAAREAAVEEAAAEGAAEGAAAQLPPTAYMFSTQFKYILNDREGYTYEQVSGFTKRAKVDVFAMDLVLVPLHVRGNHWCLAAFDMARKELSYLDSLQGQPCGILDKLLRWLRDEHQNKKRTALDTSDWTLVSRDGIPKQKNLVDCGMFMLKNADCLLRGAPLDFTQDDMPALRKRVVLELLRGENVTDSAQDTGMGTGSGTGNVTGGTEDTDMGMDSGTNAFSGGSSSSGGAGAASAAGETSSASAGAGQQNSNTALPVATGGEGDEEPGAGQQAGMADQRKQRAIFMARMANIVETGNANQSGRKAAQPKRTAAAIAASMSDDDDVLLPGGGDGEFDVGPPSKKQKEKSGDGAGGNGSASAMASSSPGASARDTTGEASSSPGASVCGATAEASSTSVGATSSASEPSNPGAAECTYLAPKECTIKVQGWIEQINSMVHDADGCIQDCAAAHAAATAAARAAAAPACSSGAASTAAAAAAVVAAHQAKPEGDLLGRWKMVTTGTGNLQQKLERMGVTAISNMPVHGSIAGGNHMLVRVDGKEWTCAVCKKAEDQRVMRCSGGGGGSNQILHTHSMPGKLAKVKGHFFTEGHKMNARQLAGQAADGARIEAGTAWGSRAAGQGLESVLSTIRNGIVLAGAQSSVPHTQVSNNLELTRMSVATVMGGKQVPEANIKIIKAMGLVQEATVLSNMNELVAEEKGSKPKLHMHRTNVPKQMKKMAFEIKVSKGTFFKLCRFTSAFVDESTVKKATSKPVYCGLMGCTPGFDWGCTFWGQQDIAGCTGEKYVAGVKAVYMDQWDGLNMWGTDGCASMRSSGYYAGVDAALGEGKSFSARVQVEREKDGKQTVFFHSPLHVVMLALKDGALAALPPQFQKFARRLHSFFSRSAERQVDFRGLSAEACAELRALAADVDGLGAEFDRALKFPKGYVCSRWLSLSLFADSVVSCSYPLWKMRERYIEQGWGLHSGTGGGAGGDGGEDHGHGGDGDDDGSEDGPPEATQYELMTVGSLHASAQRRNPAVVLSGKKAEKIAALRAADAGGNEDPGDPLEEEASQAAASALPQAIPTAAELAAADGAATGNDGAAAKKQTWWLHPEWGVNDTNIGLSALVSTFLKPFTVAQQQLQTVVTPVQHCVGRILRRVVATTRTNWTDKEGGDADGDGSGDAYAGAYEEWRQLMLSEEKGELVKLLDQVGASFAKCTIASLQKRFGHTYLQYYDAMALIDPLAPELDDADMGRAWAAAEVLCDVNGIEFAPAKAAIKLLQEVAAGEMDRTEKVGCRANLLRWYNENQCNLPLPLKEYAQMVFSIPFETVLIESLFSIMNYNKSGRRCSMADASVESVLHLRDAGRVLGGHRAGAFNPGEYTADELHARAAPAQLGAQGFEGSSALHFDTARALEADITPLTQYNVLSEAVDMKPQPASAGTKFNAFIEEWELEGDKRIRRGQGWRVRWKYVGMLLRDEDNGELRRVIGVKWHSGGEGDAGWALETQLAGSHTARATYHTLASEGAGDQKRYTIFDMINREDNEHRRPWEEGSDSDGGGDSGDGEGGES